MEPYIISLAKTMLNVSILDSDLQNMLIEAEVYCNEAGGSIVSRQIVATIIMFWKNK